MKILLKDLEFYTVEGLIIRSLELALYQAQVVIDGEEHVVWASEKKVLLCRNLTEMREKFQPFAIPKTVLRHESPYDEMIGQPMGEGNRLEVPLGIDPYAVIYDTKKGLIH